MTTFWATFVKNWATLYFNSGHSASVIEKKDGAIKY